MEKLSGSLPLRHMKCTIQSAIHNSSNTWKRSKGGLSNNFLTWQENFLTWRENWQNNILEISTAAAKQSLATNSFAHKPRYGKLSHLSSWHSHQPQPSFGVALIYKHSHAKTLNREGQWGTRHAGWTSQRPARRCERLASRSSCYHGWGGGGASKCCALTLKL